jgi:hypothetical protein
MTAPVGAGATQRTARRTVPILPRTCTRCLIAPTFRARTCWPVTPSAAYTYSALPHNFRIRSPAWCYWTPLHPNPVRRYQPTPSVIARGRPPRSRTAGRPGPPTAVFRHARGTRRANSSTARHLGSFIEESVEGSASMQQAASLTDLNGKPLIVLTADKGNDDDKWQSKQDQLTTLATNSLHR